MKKELISDISILSLEEKLIKKVLINSAKTNYKFDISGLSKGVYFIYFISIDNRFVTKKLVIN